MRQFRVEVRAGGTGIGSAAHTDGCRIYRGLPDAMRYVGPFQEAQDRLQGRAPGFLTQRSNGSGSDKRGCHLAHEKQTTDGISTFANQVERGN